MFTGFLKKKRKRKRKRKRKNKKTGKGERIFDGSNSIHYFSLVMG